MTAIELSAYDQKVISTPYLKAFYYDKKVKCQSIRFHYCLIYSVSGDSRLLQFDFCASMAAGNNHFCPTDQGLGRDNVTNY